MSDKDLVGRKVKVVNVRGYDEILTGHLEGSIREVKAQYHGTRVIGVSVMENTSNPSFIWTLLAEEYELLEEED
jgi:hypothetical protein